MKGSDRYERAARLYGAGVIVVAAAGVAFIASSVAALALAAILQTIFGWSGEKTASTFWVLAFVMLPLPLGALIGSAASGLVRLKAAPPTS